MQDGGGKKHGVSFGPNTSSLSTVSYWKILKLFCQEYIQIFFLDGKPVSFYEVKMDKVNMNLSSWEAFDIFLVLW